MDLTKSEAAILGRYREKTRIAGAVKAGYLLRLQNIRQLQDADPELSVDEGLESLVTRGLLKPTEAGDRYYLTEEGAEAVAAGPA